MSDTFKAIVKTALGVAVFLTGILLVANGVVGIVASVVLTFSLAGPLVWPETNVPSFEYVVLPWIRLLGGVIVGGAGLALFLHGLGSFAKERG